MKIFEHNISVQKTARYFSNQPGDKIRSVYFVIHGYAHLAKDFINDFDFLSDDHTLIIAPEGLSRFYFRNKIGASWMTKDDRVNEINDYVNYLNKLSGEIKNKYDLSQAKFNLLGYSQGVHTAVRWFIKSDFHFDNLILCSSDFPEDADFNELRKKLEGSKLYFIFGTKDPVISQETYKKSIELLNSEGVDFQTITFTGGHEINANSLLSITRK